METIATETEVGMSPGPDSPPQDPYRLIEVPCAPRYDDTVEVEEVPVMWLPIAEQLVAAGRDRKFHSPARRREGMHLLHAAWGAIRRIWLEEAAPAGMSLKMVAKLVGISRAQLYTILNAEEATSGRQTG